MGTGPKVAIALVVAVVVLFGLLTLAAVAKKRAAAGGGGPSGPPPMTAQELTGTAWEVTVMGHKGTIELNSGGVAVANVPPQLIAMAKQVLKMDIPPQVSGSWTVSGNALTVGVEFMGKKQQVNCEIRGRQVFYKEGDNEVEARRMR